MLLSSLHATTVPCHLPIMDPDGLPVTPGTDARENQNTSNDSNDSTEWPWGRPKREGLVFLEQALASDEPRPSYDGPDPRPNVPVGRHPGAQIFTTPLDAPLITQSVPQMVRKILKFVRYLRLTTWHVEVYVGLHGSGPKD